MTNHTECLFTDGYHGPVEPGQDLCQRCLDRTTVTVRIPKAVLADALDSASRSAAWSVIEPILSAAFDPIRSEFWHEV